MGPRLKLPPYVQAFVDRHGMPRFYFRRRGYQSVALPGLPWSPAFMSAYEAAKGEAPRIEVGLTRTTPGTVNGHHGGIVGHASVAFDGVGPKQEDLRDDRGLAQSSDRGRAPVCLS